MEAAAAQLVGARVAEQAAVLLVAVAAAVAADPWEAVRGRAAVQAARVEAHPGAEQVLEVPGRAKAVDLQDRPAVLAVVAMLAQLLVKIRRRAGLVDRLL